jgi:hypothetical protein
LERVASKALAASVEESLARLKRAAERPGET